MTVYYNHRSSKNYPVWRKIYYKNRTPWRQPEALREQKREESNVDSLELERSTNVFSNFFMTALSVIGGMASLKAMPLEFPVPYIMETFATVFLATGGGAGYSAFRHIKKAIKETKDIKKTKRRLKKEAVRGVVLAAVMGSLPFIVMHIGNARSSKSTLDTTRDLGAEFVAVAAADAAPVADAKPAMSFMPSPPMPRLKGTM